VERAEVIARLERIAAGKGLPVRVWDEDSEAIAIAIQVYKDNTEDDAPVGSEA
jgi:hypothetical protein